MEEISNAICGPQFHIDSLALQLLNHRASQRTADLHLLFRHISHSSDWSIHSNCLCNLLYLLCCEPTPLVSTQISWYVNTLTNQLLVPECESLLHEVITHHTMRFITHYTSFIFMFSTTFLNHLARLSIEISSVSPIIPLAFHIVVNVFTFIWILLYCRFPIGSVFRFD